MSTPTATTRATPATSSLASSTKFRTFAVTFAVAGTLIYLLCLHVQLAAVHLSTRR